MEVTWKYIGAVWNMFEEFPSKCFKPCFFQVLRPSHWYKRNMIARCKTLLSVLFLHLAIIFWSILAFWAKKLHNSSLCWSRGIHHAPHPWKHLYTTKNTEKEAIRDNWKLGKNSRLSIGKPIWTDTMPIQ